MKRVFCFSCSVADLAQYIDKVTLSEKRGKYHIWVDDAHPAADKFFYGEITEGKFTLTPYITGKNFHTPTFVGMIKDRENGCCVEVKLTSAKPLKFCYFVTLLQLCLSGMAVGVLAFFLVWLIFDVRGRRKAEREFMPKLFPQNACGGQK